MNGHPSVPGERGWPEYNSTWYNGISLWGALLTRQYMHDSIKADGDYYDKIDRVVEYLWFVWSQHYAKKQGHLAGPSAREYLANLTRPVLPCAFWLYFGGEDTGFDNAVMRFAMLPKYRPPLVIKKIAYQKHAFTPHEKLIVHSNYSNAFSMTLMTPHFSIGAQNGNSHLGGLGKAEFIPFKLTYPGKNNDGTGFLRPSNSGKSIRSFLHQNAGITVTKSKGQSFFGEFRSIDDAKVFREGQEIWQMSDCVSGAHSMRLMLHDLVLLKAVGKASSRKETYIALHMFEASSKSKLLYDRDKAQNMIKIHLENNSKNKPHAGVAFEVRSNDLQAKHGFVSVDFDSFVQEMCKTNVFGSTSNIYWLKRNAITKPSLRMHVTTDKWRENKYAVGNEDNMLLFSFATCKGDRWPLLQSLFDYGEPGFSTVCLGDPLSGGYEEMGLVGDTGMSLLNP